MCILLVAFWVMRNLKKLLPLLLILLPLVHGTAACGSDDNDPEPYVCSNQDRAGVWLEKWEESGGSCGPIASRVVIVDDSQSVPEGCVATAPDRWSRDNCSLELSWECMLTYRDWNVFTALHYGADVVRITSLVTAESKDLMTGSASITLMDGDDGHVCDGSYVLRYERQR